MSVSEPPTRPVTPDPALSALAERNRDESPADSVSDDGKFNAPKVVLLIVIALAPFWAIPVAHLASDPDTATGFSQYELPYYVANGRAAFERGNGVFYPNPYDPSAKAPSIYVHWLPWCFGLLTAKLGFDPGDVILTFTFFASIVFAWATWQLVALRSNSDRQQNLSFLLAMWGGGVLCAAGTIAAMANSQTWLASVLQFDPGQGMWFLNWGRNSLFPTEAIYHALVAWCWVSEIRRHRRAANISLLLLATTHPWSGIELLLTINFWRAIEFLRSRDAVNRNQLSISIATLVAFLGYYKIWLPGFPSHAELQNVWELNWSLSWTSAALAYLPVAIPCGVLLRRKLATGSLGRTEQFLLAALFVATGLAFHDRLIPPVQPLHFTRGYVWMPLFLLSLPVVFDWCHAWTQASHVKAAMVCAFAGCLFLSDNIVFSIVHSQRQFSKTDGFHLMTDERALLQTLHNLPDTTGRIVLTESETLNYLLPTYTNVRPWLGHHFNTPSFPVRKATWDGCFEDDRVHADRIPQEVDVVIARRSRNALSLTQDSAWRPLDLQNGAWNGWSRALGK